MDLSSKVIDKLIAESNKNDEQPTDPNPNALNASHRSNASVKIFTDMLRVKDATENDKSDKSDEEGKSTFDGHKRTKHDLPALASALTKRSVGVFHRQPNAFAPETALTDADLRKHVFVQTRGKQLMSGLKIHSLSKKSFVTSFSVGLAVGCLVAIVCKLLFEIAINTYTNHYIYGEDSSASKPVYHRHHRNH